MYKYHEGNFGVRMGESCCKENGGYVRRWEGEGGLAPTLEVTRVATVLFVDIT